MTDNRDGDEADTPLIVPATEAALDRSSPPAEADGREGDDDRRAGRGPLRWFGVSALLLALALSGGCGWDGHFSVLGYSTRPNYDTSIRTVYVPIFKNKVFQTQPYRRMEMQLTRLVIQEIEARTPYKVVDDPDCADTELLGTVVTFTKGIVNRNQLNEVREAELVLGVELVWRDLRTGRLLSNPPRPPGAPDPLTTPVFDPANPPLPEPADIPRPVLVQSTGRMLPELGESSATGLDMAMQRMAVLVAQLMEKPWTLPPKPIALPNGVIQEGPPPPAPPSQ